MINDYEKRMLEAFQITNYTGTIKEKVALSEIAAYMFLSTNNVVGKRDEYKEMFVKSFIDLIEAKSEEPVVMNIQLACDMLGLEFDTIFDSDKMKKIYNSNRKKFDLAFWPVIKYMKVIYPDKF